MGAKGTEEVKSHPWFKSIEWEIMLEKKATPPFVPYMSLEGDTRNFNKELTEGNIMDLSEEESKTEDVNWEGFDYSANSL